MLINGTNNGETLNGTYDSIDYIYGFGGNDTINGRFGTDFIEGHDGNDLLFGNQNSDYLTGGLGNDLLDGGTGNDTLTGGAGIDTMRGGDGDDRIDVHSVADLTGDRIDGGTGVDALVLNLSLQGATTFSVADFLIAQALAGGGSFVNIEQFGITGSAFVDRLTGYVLGDTLQGAGGNDILNGNNGNDVLEGGDGNDTITGGQGNDRADGGNGIDTIDGGLGIDFLSGGEGNDVIRGLQSLDDLSGDGGNDRLFGGLDADRIAGGTGADQVFGEAGDDILGSGAYQIAALPYDTGVEADIVDGGAGNDVVAIGVNDTARGGTGVDTLKLTFQASLVGVTFTFNPALTVLANGARFDSCEQLEFYGGLGVDNVRGGALFDQLYGGGGNDVLTAGAGNDWLSGEDGNDVLRGGLGDDTFYTDVGNDRAFGEGGNDLFKVEPDNFGVDAFDGGIGTDTVDFDLLVLPAEVDLQNQTLNDGIARGDSFTSIEIFDGTIFDDTLRGNAAANRFIGGYGDDRLEGRAGNDYLIGGGGSDILTGGAGSDVFEFGFDSRRTFRRIMARRHHHGFYPRRRQARDLAGRLRLRRRQSLQTAARRRPASQHARPGHAVRDRHRPAVVRSGREQSHARPDVGGNADGFESVDRRGLRFAVGRWAAVTAPSLRLRGAGMKARSTIWDWVRGLPTDSPFFCVASPGSPLPASGAWAQ